MKRMALIEWLLLLLTIAGTEGWKRADSIGEKIMKTILESCYGGYSSPNPVVIFGNFNELIEGVSIIRINDILKIKDYEERKSLEFKASSIVLMSQPPAELFANLERLRTTKLWNNLIPFFIIGENTAPCTNSIAVLREMWRMEILNSIYICPNSIHNRPEIYTLNPITNYAPHPWERIDKLRDLNIFRQNFDANISCTHLTYDKTEILNGYNIVAAAWIPAAYGFLPGMNYFDYFAQSNTTSNKAWVTMIRALNVSLKFEVERSLNSLHKRYSEGSVDILITMYTLHSFPGHPYLFPLKAGEMIAVVKLRAEVSTLEKIYRLWSTPVLIAAGFTLTVFFLILMIKNWSFGLALLDLTRFLTYVSIQTDNRYQSFRIYFATLLIFIVISNGVFQSKIAAFLTTRERSSAPESIDELTKLGYHMYTLEGSLGYVKDGCPSCEIKGVTDYDVCIELVLNGPKNVCIMDKIIYERKYISYPVDRVKKSFPPTLVSFVFRKNWPLRDRFNRMMMRVVESGLFNFWEMEQSGILKSKRQSLEAERASTHYRPVALRKLDFALKLLAVGLSLSTIVFLLELCWARYVNSLRLSTKMHKHGRKIYKLVCK